MREAYDGAQALDHIPAFDPHFVWMDMRMPVMDGMETTRRIRQMPEPLNRVPVAALTASAFHQDRELVLAAGCNAFVTKPFEEGDILETMARFIALDLIRESTSQERSEIQRSVEIDPTLKSSVGNLDAGLRSQLSNAIRQLDPDAIAETLKKIADLDPGTGKALSDLADEFRYQDLMAIINNV